MTRSPQFWLFQTEHVRAVLRVFDCALCVLGPRAIPNRQPGPIHEWFLGLPDDWRSVRVPSPECRTSSSVSWRQLYLVVAGTCNMSCAYCVQCLGPPLTMNREQALRIVDCFLDHANQAESIVFYGGEPLMNWSAVEATIHHVARRRPGLEMVLLTNGTLIDESHAVTLARHGVHVAVSLDGDQRSHDALRQLEHGESSHAASLRGYRLCKAAGCVTGISCTVGPHNADRISEVAAYLCDLVPANLSLSVLHRREPYGRDFNAERGAAAVLHAAAVAAQRGIEVEPIARMLRAFVTERPRRFDCPASGARLVATPDGRYGPCEGAYPSYPHFFADSVSEAETISRLFAERSRTTPQCCACPAQGICGGGCPLDAWLCTGRLDETDQRTCAIARALLRWAVCEVTKAQPCTAHTRPVPPSTKNASLRHYLNHAPRLFQTSHLIGQDNSTAYD